MPLRVVIAGNSRDCPLPACEEEVQVINLSPWQDAVRLFATRNAPRLLVVPSDYVTTEAVAILQTLRGRGLQPDVILYMRNTDPA
ncbi:MAG: hypothetical protein ACRELT_16765, partial [Longimicrobiales bacterium]